MKKVCIVTAARSEYGLLRWVIDEVARASDLQLQLIVTGGHLSEEQGYTYKAIESDGYPITAKIDIDIDSSSKLAVCKSMSVCLDKFSKAFDELKPDVLVVLGDRYELLPICSAATMLNIPIAHIAGGDITEGALDNQVRNAVTMLSTYHFPGTEVSAQRVERMRGSSKNVFVVGETNLDNFKRIRVWNRDELAESLKIDASKKWAICTYHSETVLSLEENLGRVQSLCEFFDSSLRDHEVVLTKSNADFGGTVINERFEAFAKDHQNLHVYPSLGQARYLSILYQVDFMVGNSSSGIFESPFVKVPVINLGERQLGRLYTSNIVTVDGSLDSLKLALEKIDSADFKSQLQKVENPYGDGESSKRIVSKLRENLYA